MGAINHNFSLEEVIEKAINAGNDMIIFCGKAILEDQRQIVLLFEKLVETGKIPLARLHESVAKILKLKEKYGNNKINLQDIVINQELSERIYQHACTKVINENWLPLKKSDNVLVLFPEIKLASLVDNENQKYKTLSNYFMASEIIYNFSLANLKQILESVPRYDKIILATYNVVGDDFQTKLFNQLPKDKTLVVALRSPYDLNHLKGTKNYVCLYELTPQSLQAFAKALRGETQFTSTLPIKLTR
jgi:beta-N-acetylhexosaminidase